jgi:hypothetical protein
MEPVHNVDVSRKAVYFIKKSILIMKIMVFCDVTSWIFKNVTYPSRRWGDPINKTFLAHSASLRIEQNAYFNDFSIKNVFLKKRGLLNPDSSSGWRHEQYYNLWQHHLVRSSQTFRRKALPAHFRMETSKSSLQRKMFLSFVHFDHETSVTLYQTTRCHSIFRTQNRRSAMYFGLPTGYWTTTWL